MWVPGHGVSTFFNAIGFVSILGIIILSALMYVHGKMIKNIKIFDDAVSKSNGNLTLNGRVRELGIERYKDQMGANDFAWFFMHGIVDG